LFINSVKPEKPRTASISHHAIVRPYHAGKKTKSNDALPVIMFQTFIVNQGNFFIQYCPQQFLILRLLLFGMGKKQVGFPGYQLIHRHFFYSQ
jgi:hypothetical protein